MDTYCVNPHCAYSRLRFFSGWSPGNEVEVEVTGTHPERPNRLTARVYIESKRPDGRQVWSDETERLAGLLKARCATLPDPEKPNSCWPYRKDIVVGTRKFPTPEALRQAVLDALHRAT